MMIPYVYKQTEVGVIPEDWDVRKIGDFTDITAGGTPSTSHPEYWNGEILWMSSGELNNRRIHNVIGRITELGYNNSSTHMIPKNCVLIGLAGQGKTRGTVAVNYVELCTNQSIAAIFPSKEHNSEYLYQNLRSRYAELRELSSGDGGRGGLNLTIIKNFPCAFPKLQEQNRIAEALSDVDGMISSLEKLVAKYKSIKTACLQQMFPQNGETVPRMRLPGFIGAWEQRKLGEMGQTYTGLSGKTKDDFNHGQARFVTYMNVFSNPISNPEMTEPIEIDPKQNEVEVGDVFFTTSSETPKEVGMSSVLLEKRGKTYLNSFCFGFRPSEKIDSYYLAYMLRSESARAKITLLAQGISRYNISKNKVMEIAVSLPSLDEQKMIGQYFCQLDNLITLHQRKLDKTKKIKQGMMQQLLTGKIRLVERETMTDITAEKGNLPKTKTGHNHQFDDAVMIAAIVNSFYSEKYPLGRKKVQKLLYLLRRKQEADTSEFKKKAAGPYADEIRYKGGEPIAKKNGYISATTNTKGTSFSKGKKIDEALSYVEKWKMQSDIDWLVSNFKYVGVNDLELYATIDMAICDLQNEGVEVSVDSVKELIRSNSEWKAKLKKAYFSDTDIAKAINMSYQLYS